MLVDEGRGVNLYETLLNELAQRRRASDEGVRWFDALDESQMRRVLYKLAGYITQAGAGPDDVRQGIEESGIKPTATPAVVLSRPGLAQRLATVTNLPESELRTTFCLLIAIYAVADRRRRESKCGDECTHWWHHLA